LKLETFLDTSTIYIIGAVVLLAILVLIGRLAVRWVVRLTMIGVILIALVGGFFFWWWTRSLSDKSPAAKPRPTPSKRAANR
jgi:Zn-dependent protease with chaperone function